MSTIILSAYELINKSLCISRDMNSNLQFDKDVDKDRPSVNPESILTQFRVEAMIVPKVECQTLH